MIRMMQACVIRVTTSVLNLKFSMHDLYACILNCLSTSLAALSIVGQLFDVSLMISLFEFVLNPTSVRGTRVRAFAGTIEVETLGVQ